MKSPLLKSKRNSRSVMNPKNMTTPQIKARINVLKERLAQIEKQIHKNNAILSKQNRDRSPFFYQ